ncbi:MAG: hypothetical protein AUJ92_06485 [Armatimonadetes bacterium CG2_30_59_28]|nr:HD domain-containing protein [Armatimonadota bacterium]OIO96250.1 MAG: hypothetical protein AUJ92_06485 [Armatimonadetes bacterium CG2_30_59_28]PIU64676.1 MAG: hypothetical protein COS85_11660 [Armatimonadetes bacterium CG07_land_8_20_14_0_80_59_28]PIX40329.1 MAG: hypothetical protein COZ56_15085 [Armatimonadetes bacterium CG_4_8_14_3_um_filter_58_9]PIY38624.1 MAG: hypothetical protein COZ05_20495 [Armatimonadetes bacterium CG_4_10_14_3_um_filter_59_10]PJB63816.1 MAG: hypothetical protein C
MCDKIIRDAVHGDMTITSGEFMVVDTPSFQRLRGIKQLGVSSIVYPSATHTRFEHSLGTSWMAKRILRAIEDENGALPVDSKIKKLIAVCALLHDITHVPFGHTFEDERHVLPRHDRSPDRLNYFLTGSGVEDAGCTRETVREVLLRSETESSVPPFVREIISGAICADLLDYLRRDAYHCGLPQTYDARLFRYFRLVDQHLVFDLQRRGLFRPDALSELVNLLRLRYNLTERVYYHHAKVAGGAMISKALELALRHTRLSEEELLGLRDDSFIFLLGQRCSDLDPVRDLLEDFQSRQLYSRAYVLSIDKFDKGGLARDDQLSLERRFHWNVEGERERVERDAEKALDLPEGSVLIYCPSADMALKEAEMLVRLPSNEVVALSEMEVPEVEVLQQKHRQLWRFYVLLRRRHRDLLPRCSALCEEMLGYPNMLPRTQSPRTLSPKR